MKKLKRFAAVLLAGILTLTLLTACGSDTGTGKIDKEKQDKMEEQLASMGITANDPDLYQIALKHLEADILFSKGPLFRSSIDQKGIDPPEKNVILTVTAKYDSSNTDLAYLTTFMDWMRKRYYPDAAINVNSGWAKAAIVVKTNAEGSYVALSVQVENPAFQ